MSNSAKRFWPALIAVAAIQTAVLGWMVWDRVHLLASGRELTMKVVPVDPRDMFRGDYVRLGYELSPVTHDTTTNGPLPSGLHEGMAVYVTIAADADHTWKPVSFGTHYPDAIGPGQAVLKGRVTNVYYGSNKETHMIDVRYGIESYFVPEGEGLKLEQLVREKKIEAIVAVGADGTAALKALLSDGQKISQQPAL